MSQRLEIAVVALVLALSLSVTLGGLTALAIETNGATAATREVGIGGVSYAAENVTVALPPTCRLAAAGEPTSLSFDGVTFVLRIVAWCTPAGGILNVTATESDGATLGGSIPGIPGPGPYNTWIAPDRSCGVEWDRYLTAILLVRT